MGAHVRRPSDCQLHLCHLRILRHFLPGAAPADDTGWSRACAPSKCQSACRVSLRWKLSGITGRLELMKPSSMILRLISASTVEKSRGVSGTTDALVEVERVASGIGCVAVWKGEGRTLVATRAHDSVGRCGRISARRCCFFFPPHRPLARNTTGLDL